MKRMSILFLVLILAACSAPPADSPSYFAFDSTPVLRADSSPEEIQRAMLQSALKWKTVQISGAITWYLPDGSTQVYREQAWLDPLNSRYKVMLENQNNPADKTLKFSDGENNYNVHLTSGLVERSPYPDFARAGQFVPPQEEGVAYPNPMWSQIGTPLTEMMFPANYAQGKGRFQSFGIESAAGREALIVEWTPEGGAVPAWRFWLDTTTAVILKMREFAFKDGTSALQGERVIEQIVYNLILNPSLFALPEGFAPAPQPTTAAAIPMITDSADDGRAAGELYFFLLPHQSGAAPRLARVSGVCVFDGAKCPALEIVATPFPLNFSLTPLVWSPDGSLAAFAYSDNPAGTPQKLFLFDPAAQTWRALAEFPYIDPPFWSADGAYLAFRVQDGFGGEEVYLARRDGAELKDVSAALPASGRPYIVDGWLGGELILRPALPGAGKAYLVGADGTARPLVDSSSAKSQFIPAPDGSLLAYDDYNPDAQKHELKVVRPDGTTPQTLAGFTGGSLYPIVWSPDSNLLAFGYSTLSDMPVARVHLIRRDGSQLSMAYQGVTVGRLLFSPNGKYLLVEETTSASGGQLFLVHLATLETKRLSAPGLTTDFDWYAPSWRP